MTDHTIQITAKVMGQRSPLFTPWILSLGSLNLDLFTLRDLLIAVVKSEVESFQIRQQEQKGVKVLSITEITRGMAQGKVDPGVKDPQEVDLNQAIDQVIQGFLDGLFYVFVDDIQYEDLEDRIQLRSESTLLFLKLVALQGG